MAIPKQHPEIESQQSEDDFEQYGPVLDQTQVLDCLEPSNIDDIDKAPRGIVVGVLLGAIVWAVMITAYFLIF